MSKADSIKENQYNAQNVGQNLHQDKPVLRLGWCSYKAAKYAVEHWHYSKRMPKSKLVKIGAWEDDKFIGVVLFSYGANNNLCKTFGLKQTELCELTRVALREHRFPVTRIIAVAIRMLRKYCEGLRLIISYADPGHGHIGKIYQAGNWIYDGKQQDQTEYIWQGQQYHGRTITSGARGTTIGLPKIRVEGKHRYLMPLDDEIRKRIEPLKKPYPKRATSETVDTPRVHLGKRGSTPTVALHSAP